MIITHLEQLAAQFEGFFIDQFGVLLNAQGTYPNAVQTLEKLQKMGKSIVLLSNSGKGSALNRQRLDRLGFARHAYIDVVTSGEVAFEMIKQRVGHTLGHGAHVWVHGQSFETTQFKSLGLKPVLKPHHADLLVIAGREGDQLSLQNYTELLHVAAQGKVPCICTNPDLEMLTADGVQFGPGRIAQLYGDLGGEVEWIGKPHPSIYQSAQKLVPHLSPAQIICIGDSPKHDVLGGKKASYQTALVRTGVHAAMSDDALKKFCVAEKAEPDFILGAFAFGAASR